MSFVEINQHTDYEIETEYPHSIRKRSTGRVVTVGMSHGYPRVKLNTKDYPLHRIIALQFIINDDIAGKPFVDHIDRDKENYHVENLRWVSSSENNTNKTSHIGVSYEHIEYNAINDDQLIPINTYNSHTLRNIHYDVVENRFLFDTGVEYRVMHVTYDHNTAFVKTKSLQNKQVAIVFNRVKEMYANDIANALSKVL